MDPELRRLALEAVGFSESGEDEDNVVTVEHYGVETPVASPTQVFGGRDRVNAVPGGVEEPGAHNKEAQKVEELSGSEGPQTEQCADSTEIGELTGPSART